MSAVFSASGSAYEALRGPVFVFNPSGIGGIATDVTFDPLTGCRDPKTAVDRAGDLIAGASSSIGRTSQGDREHWAGRARDTLAVLMHAAALGGASMRDVHAWVSNPQPYHNNQQIAEELFLSLDAVKSHLRSLFHKFGIDQLPQNQKRALGRDGTSARAGVHAQPVRAIRSESPLCRRPVRTARAQGG
jgi:hypothetical protein